MKKTLLSFSLVAFYSFFAVAQQPEADQNPNYKISEKKYTGLQDSLQQTNHETVQQTYQAFDFYENKLQKRKDRLGFRRELTLLRAQQNPFYNGSYGYRNYRYNDYGNFGLFPCNCRNW